MMVAYASHEASKDFNDSMIRILILSKAISSLSYFVMLFLDQAAFGYLLGFIVDGSICLSIIYMYRQLKWTKTISQRILITLELVVFMKPGILNSTT